MLVTTSAGYLEPARAFLPFIESHLHILKVHGIAEGKRDHAHATVGDAARPSRLQGAAVAVVSQSGQAAVRAAAGVAIIHAGVAVVGSGGSIDGCLSPDLDVLAVVVV